MQDIIYTAGPYASHDQARKNAKFITMKLFATCNTALGRCGESRRSNTLTMTLSLRKYTMYSVCNQTAYTASPCRHAFLYTYMYTCIYMYLNSPNYLRHGIFCCSWHCWILAHLNQYDQQIKNCN